MQHKVKLANGAVVPAIGLGTWYLGEQRARRAQEIESLKAGIGAGMTLIDTAEMYGGGQSEDLVGEVIKDYDRDSLFLVSKVLPNNAGGKKMERALEGTLKRMRTDHLDLYLYHWRGGFPLHETVDRLEGLRKDGRIKAWGVSNFDIDDMEELWEVPGGKNCQVNQVLYHTGSRGIEFSLLPWMMDHKVALMSYCPLAQGGSLRAGLMNNRDLQDIAKAHDATVAQIMLAWNIRNGKTIAIPRSSKAAHTLQNAAADAIELTAEEYAKIDAVYPKPTRKQYLDIQ